MDRKKLSLVVAYIATPLMLAWIGHAVYNMGMTMSDMRGIGHSTVYYNLPKLSVSMSSGEDNHTGTMQLSLSIEVARQDAPRVPDFQPRITERITTFIHGQNYKDLKQPGGQKMLREGLTNEINHGALPIKVAGVAITQLVFE